MSFSTEKLKANNFNQIISSTPVLVPEGENNLYMKMNRQQENYELDIPSCV